jgi:hypothetical protein
MKKKVQRLRKIYQDKLNGANEYNQHAEALICEGALMVLDTLLVYLDEEPPHNQPVEPDDQ